MCYDVNYCSYTACSYSDSASSLGFALRCIKVA